MKFDPEESVTGASFRPDAVLLIFSRGRLQEVLEVLEREGIAVDSFLVERERVTAAVFFPEGRSDLPDALFRQGILSEDGFFRLILRGSRLSEGRGIAALWESVLAREQIPVRLACSDSTGVTQYLPTARRFAVSELLNRTFGIRSL